VGCAAPLMEAVIPALEFGQEYYDALLAKYTHKKDLFLRGLDDLGIVHNDPQGAYYVMMDIREYGYDSDLRFCEDLARVVGVGAVPGSSFFREPVNHLIRFHFAKNDETLYAALDRLEKVRTLKR
jgi:aminotransferase